MANAVITCLNGPMRDRNFQVRSGGRALRLGITSDQHVSGSVLIFWQDEALRIANQTHLAVTCSGTTIASQATQELPDGARLVVGRLEFQVRILAEVEPPAGSAAETEPLPVKERPKKTSRSEERPARRISASQPVSAEPPRKSGLRNRLSLMLRPDHRRKQVDNLITERDRLLAWAGRRALEAQGGLGLPTGVVSRLAQGQQVELDGNALARPELERFLNAAKRLTQLDATLATLARELQLELPAQTETLPAEHQRIEDLAHELLDGVQTEEIAEPIDEAPLVERTPAEDPKRSGRRHHARRRH